MESHFLVQNKKFQFLRKNFPVDIFLLNDAIFLPVGTRTFESHFLVQNKKFQFLRKNFPVDIFLLNDAIFLPVGTFVLYFDRVRGIWESIIFSWKFQKRHIE